MTHNTKLKIIQNLVGNVTSVEFEKMAKNIKLYLSPNLGIFVPFLDYCDYAISPQHTHPGYSFIYNFSGQGFVKVGKHIKKSPFNNNANICAFSPGVPHEEVMENQFKSYFAICIDKDFYENQIKPYKNIENIVFEGDYFPANETILHALKRFMIEYEETLPGKEKILDALAIEITHLLIRHCYKIPCVETNITQKIEINQLISFLNENFANKINVEDMAKQIHLSPSHFSRIFKKETGLSPTDFLINLRVQKAKHSLLNKGTNITETALDCGFSSSAYFTVCFKERTGLTPTDFLKKR
jgi:AraC family transcriptional regulator